MVKTYSIKQVDAGDYSGADSAGRGDTIVSTGTSRADAPSVDEVHSSDQV